VIVRIATDGQYRLDDECASKLNDLDDEAVAAVEAGDRERFAELFGRMLEIVRSQGQEVGDDELDESDVILPPPDTSFEEAAADFTGEGLIPN
jgi:PspAA-like protein